MNAWKMVEEQARLHRVCWLSQTLVFLYLGTQKQGLIMLFSPHFRPLVVFISNLSNLLKYAIHRTVLYCTAFNSTVLHWTALQINALHWTLFWRGALHRTELCIEYSLYFTVYTIQNASMINPLCCIKPLPGDLIRTDWKVDITIY